MRKTIIAIEGNIGAGKSTLLKFLAELLSVDVVFEPRWEQIGQEGNLLNLFYQDIKRWSYTFQSYAFISRVNAQQQAEAQATGKSFCVIDRSVFCDRYCFAKNLYETGHMSSLEWQIYQDWFSWLVEKYTTKPSGFIYVRTDPQTCFKRIAKRNKAEELGIPVEYLKEIHQRHEDWLIARKDATTYLAGVPVLVIDGNTDFECDTDYRTKIIEEVACFMDACKSVQETVQINYGGREQAHTI